MWHMHTHRASCQHNYATTDEVYTMEDIVGVFDIIEARWYLVKWQGYDVDVPEWERDHLLKRDGCADTIRRFWARTGLNRSKKFYPDTTGRHRCTVCCKSFKRAQDLRGHKTRMKHHDEKTHKITATSKKDVILEKRKQMQRELPNVMWGEKKAENAWISKYLGSLFEAGGGQMTDVRARIAMALQRFDKMRHLWRDNALHQNLRIRLYKATVCSILTYDSEAWTLNDEVTKALNGANARMMG